MAGPRIRIGRYRSGNSGPDFATIGTNEQLASFTNPASDRRQLILQKGGSWLGRNSGAPVGRMALYWTAPDSSSPNNLRVGGVAAYTSEMAPTAGYVGSNGGEFSEAPLVNSAGVRTPFLTTPDYEYTIGGTNRSGVMGIAMAVAADISEPNERFYRKGISGSIPQDGVGSSVSTEGQLIGWFEGEENQPPNTPGPIVRSGGSSNRQPTMTASFSDPNERLNDGTDWDHLQAHRWELWWGGQRRWQATFTATAAERNGKYSQRQIGIQVPFDTPVVCFVAHQDRGGKWSGNRRLDFTVQSGASVDKPSAPSGRINNLSNPGNIVGVYRHNGGLSANAVQVQLRNASGAIIKASPYLTRTVAPNASTSITWAQSGFGALDPGTEYHITWQARDTNGNWSRVSDATIITTNARPNIPTPHSPANNFVSGSVNHLQVVATDPDGDSLTVTTEIRSADGNTLLGTLTMDPHTTEQNRFWIVPSGVITSYQTFTWRSRSSDGFLTSDWSPLRTYVYAEVPSVAISGPSSPVTTTQPVITWSAVSGRTHWRVEGRRDGVLVYDTGDVSGSATSHTVSASQYWLGGARWRNLETIEWTVSVRDGSTLWGSSAPHALTLEYDPIDELVITGEALSLPGVRGTHYNSITFVQPDYDESQFRYYDYRRVELTGENGAEIEGTEIHLARVTNSGSTEMVDFDVTSNQWYRYLATYSVTIGNDVIESPVVSIDLMSSWHGTLLHMPFDPLNNYVWLKYGGVGGSYEPSRIRESYANPVQPVGNRAPLDYSGRGRRVDPNGEYSFLGDDTASAMTQLDTLDRMYDNQFADTSPDGRPHIMCWREGRGGRKGRLYVRLVSFEDRPSMAARVQSVQLEFAERHHKLGVIADVNEVLG